MSIVVSGGGGRGHGVPVVVADDRDVLGDADAVFAQRVGDCAGDLVVAAEEGVRVGRRTRHRVGGAAAPCLAPLAEVDMAGGQCQARLFEVRHGGLGRGRPRGARDR